MLADNAGLEEVTCELDVPEEQSPKHPFVVVEDIAELTAVVSPL